MVAMAIAKRKIKTNPSSIHFGPGCLGGSPGPGPALESVESLSISSSRSETSLLSFFGSICSPIHYATNLNVAAIVSWSTSFPDSTKSSYNNAMSRAFFAGAGFLVVLIRCSSTASTLEALRDGSGAGGPKDQVFQG